MQIQLLNQIEATSGSTDKATLLAKADISTQMFLRYAVDPFTTFGITLDKKLWEPIVRAIGKSPRGTPALNSWSTSPNSWWADYSKILDLLAARTLTGHAARNRLLLHITNAPSEDDATWAIRILHQDLRCGISVKSVMKAFPKLVQPFEVSLAQTYEPAKHKLQGVGHIEPKLDGLRVTVVNGIPLTRNGNPVQSVDPMLDELGSQIDLKKWVLDGEFIGKGTFEETVSAARRSGQEDRGLVYNIFDMVERDEWFARQTKAFTQRRADIERHLKTGINIAVVPSIKLVNPTMAQVEAQRDHFLAQGFEGAMWKADTAYQFKRSSSLLKLKVFDTDDGEVVGVEEGTGKYEGLLGALVVKLDNGVQVKVGSGYSDAQREDLWKRRARLKGKTIEIKFQNATAKGSLRFPIFVQLRTDK